MSLGHEPALTNWHLPQHALSFAF